MKFENSIEPDTEFDRVIDALRELRVLKITQQSDGSFLFLEACDRHFGVELTKQQVLMLATELTEMANQQQST